MFPSAAAAATTDCCVVVLVVVVVISHCLRDKYSAHVLSRLTQPRRGSLTDPEAEFTHPETAGCGGDVGGVGAGGLYVNGIVVVVVHPLVLLFSFLRRFL